MIKRDDGVLLKWATKKAALERRLALPSHETLLQQHARKRAWAQQRTDEKPAASVHWSTRALLKTVISYDDTRRQVTMSPTAPKSKRKDDKIAGDFSLQWLRSIGEYGWVQRRVVMQLQSVYRCVSFLPRSKSRHNANLPHYQVASCPAPPRPRDTAKTRRCTNKPEVITRSHQQSS
jgi:hypothetical protein